MLVLEFLLGVRESIYKLATQQPQHSTARKMVNCPLPSLDCVANGSECKIDSWRSLGPYGYLGVVKDYFQYRVG